MADRRRNRQSRARQTRADKPVCRSLDAGSSEHAGRQVQNEVDGVQRDRRAGVIRPAITTRSNEVQRSFEDTSLEQPALELVAAT